MTLPEIHVHVHVDGGPVNEVHAHVYVSAEDPELKEILVATKEEILAQLVTLGDTLTEIGSDVARIAADLAAAVANNDLTAVAAKVAELQTVSDTIESALDAASPDPDDVPTPTEPETPEVP